MVSGDMERSSKKKKRTSVKVPTDELGPCEDEDKFQQVFGFHTSDLTSWNSFVRLLSRPTDPASLACIRFCFGE